MTPFGGIGQSQNVAPESDEIYAQKWNYVRDNPVRAGLVAKAEDWPYAGEIITIDRF